jgi:CheY-like chemotaxis protein
MVPIRIQYILKEVLELSRSAIPSTIEIHQKIQSKCGPVLADPTQIHQVMMNIITNAYHAIDEDGGQIRIELKEAELSNDQSFDLGIKAGRYIKLNISDTGPGIPDTLVNKIFDPYFTTKGEGQGTGLGLAVVHGIIKEHQGAIRVTSEPGKGATFNIFLPLIKESTNSVQPKEDNGNFQTGEEKILVVDDEPSIAMLEKQMLERLGYKVSSFHNSIEALNTFKAKPEFFDLVISDMSMPEFSGIRLAKKLRKIRPDIPIIICSGLSCEMNTQHIESIKINGFLVKPVTRTELAKTIRAVLGQIEN